jgi:hypothetical protein
MLKKKFILALLIISKDEVFRLSGEFFEELYKTLMFVLTS